jgi:hypothetical protein
MLRRLTSSAPVTGQKPSGSSPTGSSSAKASRSSRPALSASPSALAASAQKLQPRLAEPRIPLRGRCSRKPDRARHAARLGHGLRQPGQDVAKALGRAHAYVCGGTRVHSSALASLFQRYPSRRDATRVRPSGDPDLPHPDLAAAARAPSCPRCWAASGSRRSKRPATEARRLPLRARRARRHLPRSSRGRAWRHGR